MGGHLGDASLQAPRVAIISKDISKTQRVHCDGESAPIDASLGRRLIDVVNAGVPKSVKEPLEVGIKCMQDFANTPQEWLHGSRQMKHVLPLEALAGSKQRQQSAGTSNQSLVSVACSLTLAGCEYEHLRQQMCRKQQTNHVSCAFWTPAGFAYTWRTCGQLGRMHVPQFWHRHRSC